MKYLFVLLVILNLLVSCSSQEYGKQASLFTKEDLASQTCEGYSWFLCPTGFGIANGTTSGTECCPGHYACPNGFNVCLQNTEGCCQTGFPINCGGYCCEEGYYCSNGCVKGGSCECAGCATSPCMGVSCEECQQCCSAYSFLGCGNGTCSGSPGNATAEATIPCGTNPNSTQAILNFCVSNLSTSSSTNSLIVNNQTFPGPWNYATCYNLTILNVNSTLNISISDTDGIGVQSFSLSLILNNTKTKSVFGWQSFTDSQDYCLQWWDDVTPLTSYTWHNVTKPPKKGLYEERFAYMLNDNEALKSIYDLSKNEIITGEILEKYGAKLQHTPIGKGEKKKKKPEKIVWHFCVPNYSGAQSGELLVINAKYLFPGPWELDTCYSITMFPFDKKYDELAIYITGSDDLGVNSTIIHKNTESFGWSQECPTPTGDCYNWLGSYKHWMRYWWPKF